MGPDIGKMCPVWDVRGVSTERSVKTARCCHWDVIIPYNMKQNTPSEMNFRAVIHQNMGETHDEKDYFFKKRSIVVSFGACTLPSAKKVGLETRARALSFLFYRNKLLGRCGTIN